MKAIVITGSGGPEVLQIQNRELEAPGPGEIQLKVHAAGVNRPDVSQRKGHYPPPPGASPDVPGLEVSGVVVQSGPAASRFKRGDKVCALLSGGGYAEFCNVPEGQCLPIPGTLSFTEAAAIPETFFTVWNNVFERGKLGKGESLLVHGGSSGIGVAAIQLAKVWGATVYVTAGSEEKCSFCETLGCTKAINYRKQNFREEIKRITNQRGVNVILDMIGGDYTPDNIELLTDDGRLVMINFMKGEESVVKWGPIMRKRLVLTGSTLRPRDTAFKSALAARIEEHVWPWLSEGKVKPVIYKTFPMEQVGEAHRLMESSVHVGKIILLMGQ